MKLLLPVSLFLLAGPAWSQGADDCGAATPIAGEGTWPVDTVGATTDGFPSVFCGFEGLDDVPHDVWFRWTATTGGDFQLELDVDGYGKRIAVYDGCGASTPLSCERWNPASITGAVAGSSYLIRVGGEAQGFAGTLTVTAGVPVEPTVANPSNGNHYRVVTNASIHWSNAKLRAESTTYMGVQGHLATIRDADEDAFVYGLRPGFEMDYHWLGGFQDVGAPDYAEPAGGWRWVTGEPWCYANVFLPNDGPGTANHLALACAFCPIGTWSAYGDNLEFQTVSAFGYVIEFETGPPCAGAAGTTYCTAGTHSLGAQARICAVGSRTVAEDQLCLSVVDLPPGSPGLFFFGAAPASLPLAGGTRCVGGRVYRTAPLLTAGADGRTALHVDFAAHASEFTPGATRYFQYWYRDGAAGANLTDGVQVTFD